MVGRCRLHVVGASGTGTTTLGRAMANEWAVPHADVDDYFWEPTSPPFRAKRAVADRLRLMHAVFVPRGAWVLSGSLMGWGDGVTESFDATVFLTLDRGIRLERLEQRELRRGVDEDAVDADAHRSFMAWAGSYDEPDFDGRSRNRHEAWLRTLRCPVLHLDSSVPVTELVRAITAWSP